MSNATFTQVQSSLLTSQNAMSEYISIADIDANVVHGDNTEVLYNNSGQIDGVSSWTTNGTTQLNGADNALLRIGTGADLTLTHNATNSVITSATGDLIIDNTLATGSTINRLGTDTNATDFQIQNNSEAAILTVQGNNALIVNKTAVSQATNINTTVVANTAAGAITTQTATTATTATDSFTVTNATCAATSVVLANIVSYSGTYITNGIPVVGVSSIGAGSFQIDITNAGTNALNGTFVIHFIVV
jgi:hypothetical protein